MSPRQRGRDSAHARAAAAGPRHADSPGWRRRIG